MAAPADNISIFSDAESLGPLWALRNGNIEPLIKLLGKETGRLHPLLARELVDMLRGTHQHLGLKITRSARGSPKRRGAESASHDRVVAAYVDGMLNAQVRKTPGIKKVAVGAAAKKFGMSDRAVQRAIKATADGEERLRRFMEQLGSRQ